MLCIYLLLLNASNQTQTLLVVQLAQLLRQLPIRQLAILCTLHEPQLSGLVLLGKLVQVGRIPALRAEVLDVLRGAKHYQNVRFWIDYGVGQLDWNEDEACEFVDLLEERSEVFDKGFD